VPRPRPGPGAGQATYHIDYYQREYAWSADDVRTLVTDLFEAFDLAWQEGRPRRRESSEPFFLGPFVYVEEKRQVRFLVDGQQRFTTLHLLFLHLHRAASAWGQRDVERNLDRVITDYVGSDRPQFRIDIEERREALEALYRDRPYELPARASLSVRNLHDRSLQIGELLEELLEADRCQLFVDWLLTKVVMVGIRAPSRDSGFRIFESMNDRGAPPDPRRPPEELPAVQCQDGRGETQRSLAAHARRTHRRPRRLRRTPQVPQGRTARPLRERRRRRPD
jgi:hypothetical protein